MRRRAVIAGCGGAVATLTSGCTGLLSEDDGQGSTGGAEDDEDDEEGERTATDAATDTDVETVSGNATGAERRAVERVVRQNLRATEEHRPELLRATLHPDAPSYDRTIEQTRQIWDQYELEYSLTVQSISVSGNEATVEYEQVTRATGPNSDVFTDNRLTAVGTLRTYQGEWRVYGTRVENVEYLE
ncbi:hypothetical protein [Halorientalis pallida]|uniref:SnoaL-like domain-containing protein n=1 Tax=Halorientalis pallida TaxID=2479928 RepID=A0A498L816_9EURY|nr:hypothetical protein [Halorientalis pallida]RXK51313.1 hypothetical protein EAF64_01330 [Halorientalis pallida]